MSYYSTNRTGAVRGDEGGAASLSNSHICTHGVEANIQFWQDGSVIRVKRGSHTTTEHKGGGKRGAVTGFSAGSRRRLTFKLNTLKRGQLPIFVTLTFPENYPDVQEAKRLCRALLRKLRKEFPHIGLFWKLEPQTRGAPHFHLLIWNYSEYILRRFIPKIWYEIAGQGDENHLLFHLGCLPRSQHCVQQVRSWNGVMYYVAKYFSKEIVENWDNPGRFWGCSGKEYLPWADILEFPVTEKQATIFFRLFRRVMHIRAKQWHSLRLYCDANQWLDKFDRLMAT